MSDARETLPKWAQGHIARLEERVAKHARAELLHLMEYLSEEHWCAGWIMSNEFILWEIVTTGRRHYGMGGLTEDEVSRLRELAEDAGGWIAWDDDSESGTKFIPMKKWLERYAKQEASR